MKGQTESLCIPQKQLCAVLELQTLEQAPHSLSFLSLPSTFGYQNTFLFDHNAGYSKWSLT